jgi:actin-related protein 6
MRHFLDNGAYSLKFGSETSDPVVRQNCIASVKSEIFVSPHSLVNVTEVLRPHDRGVLVDPELQLKIWKSVIQPEIISTLVYTCPIFTPPSCRRQIDELVYEDLMLAAAMRVPTGPTNNYNTYPINYAATRVCVGGKLMTNFMKEQISYRQFDMTEETWLVNLIREQLCYVSISFLPELRKIQ